MENLKASRWRKYLAKPKGLTPFLAPALASRRALGFAARIDEPARRASRVCAAMLLGVVSGSNHARGLSPSKPAKALYSVHCYLRNVEVDSPPTNY